MKKLSILFSAFLILLFAGSCHHKKTYKIGISQCSSDDWRAKMNQEIQLEALLHDDIEVEIRSAHDDSQKQIEDLEYFASKGFDVIVVAPNEAETLTPEIKKIYESGIPVIIFDRNINDTTYTQRIGVNNTGLGELAAEYAVSRIPDSLKVIEIFGLPGSTPAQERSSGFKTILSEGHGKIIASASGNWNQEDATKVADSLLRLYPDANLIYAHNDRMAIGAAESAKNLGLDHIRIIGIDAAPQIGIKAVADGIIDATFLYPTEGHQILRHAINMAKGGSFERELYFPTTSAVDASNVDILMVQNENIEEDTKKVMALKGQLDNYVSLHNAQTALVYAIIAILVLLFGVLFLVLRTFWAHRRHQSVLMRKNKMLEEERDKQKELNIKLEKATQSKLVFFTNVSHDLRTPLTLIAEPVSQLNSAENLDDRQKNLIKIADKNIKILGRLINQILDFRKFENDKLTLSLTEINFNQAIKEWLESFSSVAHKRDIKLVLDAPDQECNLAVDVEKMERIIFNLVSNALKYSPDNSTITISYSVNDKDFILKVADNGMGISRSDMAHIFDQFFQVDRVRPQGSGLGLVLVKAFVELHGGEISVESELKKGSVFTVRIPVRHVAGETSVVMPLITSADINSELGIIETEKVFDSEKPVLLVIDDNKDIREMVSELMKDDYNVITAPSGHEGLRKAAKYVPDLIICDVMMPGMDGMECCTRLKSETITSHIPVLMLTACSLDEQKVQGFDSGADGYLAKPFSTPVLKAHVKSLIQNRKILKDVLKDKHAPAVSKAAPSTKESAGPKKVSAASGISEIENDFYNKFIEVFEKNIGNPDLNVEAIASELGFERTQLYRKIKAITNYSPVELMRSLRLKKARAMLKTTDKSISEICYEVGFSTPAYFTKCYKEQFGETPSDTRG